MNSLDSKFWLDVAHWIGTVGLAFTIWLRKPGTDAGLAVTALKADMDARFNTHTQRLTEIEVHMEHMATSEALMQLEGTVKQIGERTAGIDERLKTVSVTLGRIETFLLNKSH